MKLGQGNIFLNKAAKRYWCVLSKYKTTCIGMKNLGNVSIFLNDLIDFVDSCGYVLKAGVEPVKPLLADHFEVLLGFLGSFASGLKAVCCLLESLFDSIKLFHGLHVWSSNPLQSHLHTSDVSRQLIPLFLDLFRGVTL